MQIKYGGAAKWKMNDSVTSHKKVVEIEKKSNCYLKLNTCNIHFNGSLVIFKEYIQDYRNHLHI